MAMEELELTDAQAQALLDSPTPLADVYHHFEQLETGYMDVIRDSIENRANEVCKARAELRETPIHPHSADYAREHGELEQYRASNRLNVQCKEAIEAAVREHFDGMYLNHDAAKGVINTYGLERVMHVLANTIQLQEWIKYRFHSLPGNSGGRPAGTERKGCDVCLRDGKLSRFDFREH